VLSARDCQWAPILDADGRHCDTPCNGLRRGHGDDRSSTGHCRRYGGRGSGHREPFVGGSGDGGIYTFNTEGSPPAEWTIYPLCTPTVGDLRVPLELPVACKLKVVSATPGKYTFELNNLNWGGDAKLTDGQ
jgi:hypothetical protein